MSIKNDREKQGKYLTEQRVHSQQLVAGSFNLTWRMLIPSHPDCRRSVLVFDLINLQK